MNIPIFYKYPNCLPANCITVILKPFFQYVFFAPDGAKWVGRRYNDSLLNEY